MKTRSAFVLAGIFCVAISQAAINLTHNGSVVNIDETTSTVNNWFVGGIDNVFAHSYYFRVGDGSAASLVSTLGAPSVTLFGTRGAEVKYQSASLRITLNYFLTAAGGTADLAETALVENLTGSAQAVRLFQYNDYDMNGTSGNDVGERLNSSTIKVTDGAVSTINAIEGGAPIPDFTEIALWPNTRNNITGTAGYNLDTAAGSGIGQTVNGDIAYAFQWNKNLAGGGSFIVSTDKITAVPEPASMVALGLGAVALLRRRRKVA
jgi:hypothetical protein